MAENLMGSQPNYEEWKEQIDVIFSEDGEPFPA